MKNLLNALAFATLIFVSCTKSEVSNSTLRVRSLYCQEVYSDQFTAISEIVSGSESVADAGIVYSSAPFNLSNIDGDIVKGVVSGEKVTTTVDGLDPLSSYYWVAYVADSKGNYSYGAIQVVQTLDDHVLDFDLVDCVLTSDGATLTLNIINDGNQVPREYGAVVWNASLGSLAPNGGYHAVTLPGAPVNIPDEAGNVAIKIGGLAPQTEYYFEVFAKNSRHPIYNEPVKYTTEAETPPTGSVGTLESTIVYIDVKGVTVTNKGSTNNLAYGIFYSDHPIGDDVSGLAPIEFASPLGSDNMFSVKIDQLMPNTTYYIRAYIDSRYVGLDGNSYGELVLLAQQTIDTKEAKVSLEAEELGSDMETILEPNGNQSSIKVYGCNVIMDFTKIILQSAATNDLAKYTITLNAKNIDSFDYTLGNYGFWVATSESNLSDKTKRTDIPASNFDADRKTFSAQAPDFGQNTRYYYCAYADLDEFGEQSLGVSETLTVKTPIYGGKEPKYDAMSESSIYPNQYIVADPAGLDLFYNELRGVDLSTAISGAMNSDAYFLDRNLGSRITGFPQGATPPASDFWRTSWQNGNYTSPLQDYQNQAVGWFFQWGLVYPSFVPVINDLFKCNNTTNVPGYTDTYATGMTDWNDAAVSPCPKGYRLPTLAEWSATLSATIKEAGSSAGVIVTSDHIEYMGPRFGFMYTTQKLGVTGQATGVTMVKYWASDQNNATQGKTFSQTGNPGGRLANANTNKELGNPVRCVRMVAK